MLETSGASLFTSHISERVERKEEMGEKQKSIVASVKRLRIVELIPEIFIYIIYL